MDICGGEFLLIYLCNFHVLSHLLLMYICKLHWNRIRSMSSVAWSIVSNQEMMPEKLMQEISGKEWEVGVI